jgi:polyisoprenyl-phosphate glycosyltransferase
MSITRSKQPTYDFSVPATSPRSGQKSEQPATVALSVVIPVYQAEQCLPALHARLTNVLSKITENYEIVLVEDCGRDNSWSVINNISRLDNKVHGFKLSRNFGQHAAITAGLAASRGDWVIVMDCDLQDPPEDIPKFIAKAKEGYDMVVSKRVQKKQSAWRVLCARAYFALLKLATQNRVNGHYGTFSVINRQVVDAYLKFTDHNRHYAMILLWLGFRRAEIDYEQDKRWAGASSYSPLALARHALQGLFFHTTILLHLSIYTGFAVSLCGLGLAGWFSYRYYIHSALPGWTSLTVLMLLLSGIILITLGITGLYIGQIFEQVKARPLFIFGERTQADTVSYANTLDSMHVPMSQELPGIIADSPVKY